MTIVVRTLHPGSDPGSADAVRDNLQNGKSAV